MVTPPAPATLSIPGTTTLVTIGLFFLAAWLVSWLLGRLLRRVLRPRVAGLRRASPERAQKFQVLIGSLVTFVAFGIAAIASLSLFISTSTLIWILGLFSAAFGLSAKPLVSDLLAGMGFLFSNTFDIGEKVELIIPGSNIQGVIEQVNLTATLVRAPSGEEFTIPNGEIRIVRNFSRGKYSTVTLSLQVAGVDLDRSLEVLKQLGAELYDQDKDLIEPWQILSKTELATSKVALDLIAHAPLGQGAELKLRLIRQVQERLAQEGIPLVD